MQNGPDNIYIVVLLGMAGTLLLCIAIILFYTRYQKKFYLQQKMMNDAALAHQVDLLHNNIQSQETERRRISKDLHDDVGSHLANLNVQICKITYKNSKEELEQMIANCRQLTDSIINTVRNISHNLSPSGLEVFGFSEALGDMCERTAMASGIEIKLKNGAETLLQQLDINTSLALYRVIQELLTNTIKHAGANEVTIELTGRAAMLAINYNDNGKGMNENTGKKGMGLYNIESRLSMIHALLLPVAGDRRGFSMRIEVPIEQA